jgi:DNA-binding GntR family transcriptional regulator
MNISDLNLTPLETQVVTALIEGLYAEPGYSDVDAKDIAKELGISTKIIRGALGSLVKKRIVDLDDNGEYVIIYLMREYWGLVNENWEEAAKDAALNYL